MANVVTSDGVYIAKAMKTLLNSWPDKPAPILLEDLGKEATSMMLQQLAAAEKRREYVNGSYVGVWNFAVYIRIEAEDTESRLDATGSLQALADWLQETDSQGCFAHLPVIDDRRVASKIEMTSSPSLVARMEDGTEDYQAVFSLEYKATRR